MWEDLLQFVSDDTDSQVNPTADESRAKGTFFLFAMQADCVFQSTEKHIVERSGFSLTHAFYFNATAAQGQTHDTGVIIDCARIPPQGLVGMSDDTWWLNLYVMFSRVTRMSDILLIRPPPRSLLKKGHQQVCVHSYINSRNVSETFASNRRSVMRSFDSTCLRCNGEKQCPQTL